MQVMTLFTGVVVPAQFFFQLFGTATEYLSTEEGGMALFPTQFAFFSFSI